MLVVLFFAALLLSYSNGANDNFKGVATLWGSGTLQYKPALILATITTFAGSVCSYFFATILIENFSGKGLVPDDIMKSIDFVLAIAFAGGVTVLLATKMGFPVSTTHSLVGALVGAGLIAVGSAVNFSKLGKSFFLPLVLGPIFSLVLSVLVYWLLRNRISEFLKSKALNRLHFISAGAVGFARGLNDTPKFVSLLLICNLFSTSVNVLLLAVAMAAGGILNAKRIAETMSKKISIMNDEQGFTANIINSILVIVASNFGVPVSTTHVSVGSIFGIGLINKTANYTEILKIALSWLLTLPIAAALSSLFYFIIHNAHS